MRTPKRGFVSVYLINFSLQFFVLDFVNQYLSGYRSKNDDSYMAAAIVLSLLYVLVIWALSAIPSFKRTSSLAFDTLVSGGYPFSRYAILLWLMLRIYLLGKYGIRSLSYLDPFEHGVAQGSPLSYVENVFLLSLQYLASGAVMALVIRLALQGYRGISLLEWSLLIVFFGFILLGEAPLGVRRTVILYAILFITTYSISRNRSTKVFGLSLVIGAIGVAFIEYYQQIRFNAQNPRVIHLLSSGNIPDMLSGLVAYLTPGTQPSTAHGFRSGGLDYLATCIRWVEQSGRIIGGGVMLFALYMVIPSALFSGKPTIDIDTFIMKFYRAEDTDYAANILANMYVDLGVLSIVVSPFLWVSTMYFMLLILSRAKTNGPLALSVSGMIFGMLSLVEGSLVSLFVYLRDILIVLPVFYLIGLVFGRSKGIASVHGSPDSPNAQHPDLSAGSSVQCGGYQLLSNGPRRQE